VKELDFRLLSRFDVINYKILSYLLNKGDATVDLLFYKLEIEYLYVEKEALRKRLEKFVRLGLLEKYRKTVKFMDVKRSFVFYKVKDAETVKKLLKTVNEIFSKL